MTTCKSLFIALLLTTAPALVYADTAPDAAFDRTVAVSGSAFVTVEPDIARINMSIVERDLSLRAAQQAAGTATNNVLALLKKLGIELKHINTTGAMIRPDYRWNRETEEQELLGYVVERNIAVELHDLDKLGPLIEQVTEAGVNQLSPPQLDSSKRRDAYRDALAKAFKDAYANAETLAGAAGEELGAVLSINSSSTPIMPMPRMRVQSAALSADASGGAESYVAGEIRFDAQVSVVYALTGK